MESMERAQEGMNEARGRRREAKKRYVSRINEHGMSNNNSGGV